MSFAVDELAIFHATAVESPLITAVKSTDRPLTHFASSDRVHRQLY